MPARDYEQTAKRDVLADHHPELGDLGIREVLAQLGHERRVDPAEIRGELLSEADRETISWLEAALSFRKVDLGDRVFVETLTRRRRVAGEQSGVAVVQGRDLEARQLLDPGGHHAVFVTGTEEREVATEEIGDQLGQVQAASRGGFVRLLVGRGHGDSMNALYTAHAGRPPAVSRR